MNETASQNLLAAKGDNKLSELFPMLGFNNFNPRDLLTNSGGAFQDNEMPKD